MKPTNNIGYLLQHTASTLARQSDQVLQERLGIGFSQFKILMTLQWNPSVQQKHIAESLGQTEASISRQIKLMHEASLLQSKISPRNKREHITTLTHKGQRLADEALNVLNGYHAPMWEAIGEKGQRQLIELLRSMHQEACKGDKPGRCHQSYLD
ncbi:MAG TPA: MarR family winged helix-turn-helix transcriptional regulator [Verrucomicrobiae bacterium]|nr:MarR family winged helix-turn-helix transcriptional regulator [Verrucomicrobiae bacterium]